MCRQEKPSGEFYIDNTRVDGLHRCCKTCYKLHRKRWQRNNLARYLERTYGLTEARYLEILESQGSKCPGCGLTPEELGARLVVDHDHATGKIRGLLCVACNAALGQVRDNPVILASLVEYLWSPPVKEIQP